MLNLSWFITSCCLFGGTNCYWPQKCCRTLPTGGRSVEWGGSVDACQGRLLTVPALTVLELCHAMSQTRSSNWAAALTKPRLWAHGLFYTPRYDLCYTAQKEMQVSTGFEENFNISNYDPSSSLLLLLPARHGGCSKREKLRLANRSVYPRQGIRTR